MLSLFIHVEIEFIIYKVIIALNKSIQIIRLVIKKHKEI